MPLLPLLAALAPLVSAGYSSYSLGNLPHTSESGQTGVRADEAAGDHDASIVTHKTDFCLWAPPTPGGTIGDTEEIEVACQITGTGDFTKINIAAGDAGGELDPHGATGNGNPIGSLVYANGQQIHEWTSISDSEFCFRICHDAPDAWLWCQHIYDLQVRGLLITGARNHALTPRVRQGCAWNEPGNYGGGFDSCEGDSTEYPPGVYMVNGQLSTYQQSQGAAPTPHAAGASSNCQAVATVGGAAAAYAPATTTSSAAPSSAWSSSIASSTTWSSSAAASSSTPVSSSWTTSTVVSSSSVLSSSVVSSFATVSTSTAVVTTARSAAIVTSSVTQSRSSSLSSASAVRGSAQPAAAAASTSAHNSGAQKLAAAAGMSLFAVAAGMAVFA
ncbi:hypothetical protein C6P46_005204 [Rhodotorula mucilaginosa]|uniref:Uncharacterized protein n=1 Tax=Rhodotorula mucilaginosa TaxID=5537 RepID=A0A9P6VZH3_RHOMI|nr:hypothetical protein C6P46_005204 [Rhodotorula mucilaginosa]